LQRRGQIPRGGIKRMYVFQGELIAFEPKTEGQKLLHGETLRAYNEMIKARNLRLDAVQTGLPAVMWGVVILGAFIGLTASFFFRVEESRLQIIQVLLLAIFIGLVIFMTFALDRPFRGDLGVGPNAFQMIYDAVMKQD
jgi:predicted lipid-binding transport protein (Tim44 family)